MMIKNHFLKELQLDAPQQRNSGNSKKDVMKIQSWLTLYEMSNPNSGTFTSIDGDFGSATETAVKNYQAAIGVQQDGVVDQSLFDKLCSPLKDAFLPINGTTLRQSIVDVAIHHLNCQPRELVIKKESNSGPWVRSYMDGHEGESWFWCMGFVQTVLDQAASLAGKDFRKLMPVTYSCDTVGTVGLQNGNLSRYTAVRANPGSVKPGDIFLLQKSPQDWIHTGIILNINLDTVETIEGNTNSEGSPNGNGVYRRVRNYMKSKLDVFSIESIL